MNPQERVDDMLSKKLVCCRKACRLTQLQMAKALGINRTTYTCYETGKTSLNIETLCRIAKILNVGVEQFLPSDSVSKAVFSTPPTNYKPKIESELSFSCLNLAEKELVLLFRQLSKDKKNEILEITKSKRDELFKK